MVRTTGAVGSREVVTAAGIDECATVVVLGDSTGHLRVLDISAGIDTSSPDAVAASFKEVGALGHTLHLLGDMIPGRFMLPTTTAAAEKQFELGLAGCSGSVVSWISVSVSTSEADFGVVP